MRPPGVSDEAWAAAMVIDGVIQDFFARYGMTRNVERGKSPVIGSIAKLVQEAIDMAMKHAQTRHIN